MILIDNYDSFTYNIVQALQMLGEQVEVVRNQSLSVAEVLEKKPSHLVIGPGPGRPAEAGITTELIVKARVPVLGICLGHQAIGEVFGARVVRAPCVMHGKTTSIHHHGTALFHKIPNLFTATRYHSLILEDLPDDLEITAWSEQGEVMGLRHIKMPLFGVQFHPESVATHHGLELLKNFINYEH